MKKKIFILILFIFLVTGCTNIYDMSTEQVTDLAINTHARSNVNYQGYKFYLPNGITIINGKQNNFILYSNEGDYYLYIDIISYFNKTYNINKNPNAIYSRDIEIDGIKGLIEVSEENGMNVLKVLYNYGKIEVLTTDIKLSIAKSLVILKSITYNDKVITSILKDNVLYYDEEVFTLNKNNKSMTNGSSNFLQYEEEYGTYNDKDNEFPDEDKIEVENNN